MPTDHLKIGFVRRGFSRSGGAEAYLTRLAQGVAETGHSVQLFTTAEWPRENWPVGEVTHVSGLSPRAFADEVERIHRSAPEALLVSLERIWSCDVYRAGDGVHRAWMQRRLTHASSWRRLTSAISRKHAAILRLEEALFRDARAGRVVANSQMVKTEIMEFYGYPAERIDVVPNGVPLAQFAFTAEERARSREALGLAPDDIAVLFVGSGWKRKGLIYALRAVEKLDDRRLKFLVAGRGNTRAYRSNAAQFLGEVSNVAALYRASDIFVLPTLYDPFSNACLEALASGLPVITTRSNGFAEIIDDGVHGSILDEPAVGAVGEAILFWSDPEKRSAARPEILKRAAQFDISRNVARTLKVLLQAANAASTSGKMRNT